MREIVRQLEEAIVPVDSIEAEHRLDVLRWLDSGDGIFRTAKPATPPKHLVPYSARWWSFDDVSEDGPVAFDPHLPRFITKLRASIT